MTRQLLAAVTIKKLRSKYVNKYLYMVHYKHSYKPSPRNDVDWIYRHNSEKIH